jgi:hypothetical protein
LKPEVEEAIIDIDLNFEGLTIFGKMWR